MWENRVMAAVNSNRIQQRNIDDDHAGWCIGLVGDNRQSPAILSSVRNCAVAHELTHDWNEWEMSVWVSLAVTSHMQVSVITWHHSKYVCVSTVYMSVYTGHRATIWSFLTQASSQILVVWSHTAGSRSSIPRLARVCACVRVHALLSL